MTEVVVFGATGQVGRQVVRELLLLGVRPRIYTRNPAQAEALFDRTVTVVSGDFENAAALKRATRNVDSVFLASPLEPRQVTWQANMVEAAKETAPLVVKLSGLATFPGSYVDSGRWHAETEAAIRAAELPHVFLHPYFFLQNLAKAVPPALRSGVLGTNMAEARIAPIDVRDIGAVAARLLTGQVNRTGTTLRLTTAETFTYASLAARLSELSGHAIAIEERSDGQFRRGLADVGLPDWHIEILLQFSRAFREGLGAQLSHDVEDVLERSPRLVGDYLQELVC